MKTEHGEIIHFFHWPALKEYQEKLINVIALPSNAFIEIEYREERINPIALEVIKRLKEIKESDLELKAIFWGLNISPKIDSTSGKTSNEYSFVVPLRMLKIIECRYQEENKRYSFYCILKEYISPKEVDKDGLQAYLPKIGSSKYPYPGEHHGFVHVEKTEILSDKIELTSTLSYDKLSPILKKINKLPDCDYLISEYPLINISSINSVFNDCGFLNIYPNRTYQAKFTYFQNSENRKRDIIMQEELYRGQTSSTKIITINEKDVKAQNINILVKADNINYQINFKANIIKKLYHRKRFPLIAGLVASILALLGFVLSFPDSEAATVFSLLFALIVMFIGKLVDILQKEK